jgi:hypothetical protein
LIFAVCSSELVHLFCCTSLLFYPQPTFLTIWQHTHTTHRSEIESNSLSLTHSLTHALSLAPSLSLSLSKSVRKTQHRFYATTMRTD